MSFDPIAYISSQYKGVPKDIFDDLLNYLCQHNNYCHLKSTLFCCYCADENKYITVYRDGLGTEILDKSSEGRFDYYCQGCKDHQYDIVKKTKN